MNEDRNVVVVVETLGERRKEIVWQGKYYTLTKLINGYCLR